MAEKITSKDIRAAMLKTFSEPEWAVMWEVAAGTGGTRDNRSADAVMMSLWPSRGLNLHGVEIKVSRSDWKREAADPSKAERIAVYCDYWWVHVAPGVIHDLAEVPMTWGVREWDGKRWKTVREATRLEAKPIDRTFLASLLRRADQAQDREIEAEVLKRVRVLEADIDDRIKRGIEDRTRHNSEAVKFVEGFQAATGLELRRYDLEYDGKEIGAIVRLIRTVGLDAIYGGLRSLIKSVADVSEKMNAALVIYDEGVAERKLIVSPDVKDLQESRLNS